MKKTNPKIIPYLLNDYFSGMNRKELSKKYDIAERTLGDLIAEGGWAKAKSELSKKCTKTALKETSDNYIENAKLIGKKYGEIVNGNIHRLAKINEVLGTLVQRELYTNNGSIKKKINLSTLDRIVKIQQSVKDGIGNALVEANWSEYSKQFDGIKTLHDLSEAILKNGSKIFNTPDQAIGKMLDAIHKHEHVSAMKYNRIPYYLAEQLMAVSENVVRKFIDSDDPKYQEAISFLQEKNSEIAAQMDK